MPRLRGREDFAQSFDFGVRFGHHVDLLPTGRLVQFLTHATDVAAESFDRLDRGAVHLFVATAGQAGDRQQAALLAMTQAPSPH